MRSLITINGNLSTMFLASAAVSNFWHAVAGLLEIFCGDIEKQLRLLSPGIVDGDVETATTLARRLGPGGSGSRDPGDPHALPGMASEPN
jgi:hypothetical protein